jgi:hypothetical protein
MHKAVYTPDNAAMLLIDHQIGTMPGRIPTTSISSNKMHSSSLESPRRRDCRLC